MNNSTVVILSGGLDSSVLLASAVAEGKVVKALSVDYGQRHRLELAHAAKVAAHFDVEHRVADLRGLRQFMAGSSQTDDRVSVPQGHYADETMRLTVVPNRNMVMLAVAGAWAISLKYGSVSYAAHAGDHAVYPDCREEFAGPLAEALRHADWHCTTIERPFLSVSKADIVRLGAKLEFPFEMTYSCYEGQPVHCGRCGTCVERRMAFIEAGVPDPTPYASDLDERYDQEARAKAVA